MEINWIICNLTKWALFLKTIALGAIVLVHGFSLYFKNRGKNKFRILDYLKSKLVISFLLLLFLFLMSIFFLHPTSPSWDCPEGMVC